MSTVTNNKSLNEIIVNLSQDDQTRIIKWWRSKLRGAFILAAGSAIIGLCIGLGITVSGCLP